MPGTGAVAFDPGAAYSPASFDPGADYSPATATPTATAPPVPWYKQALSSLNSGVNKVSDYMTAHPAQLAAVGYGMPVPAQSPLESTLDALPEMPSAKLARASAAFNEVRNDVGDLPVKTTDQMKSALDQIKEASGVGTRGGGIADKVMSRLANSEESPLSYDEARTLYSNLGELTTQDTNKNMLRLLGQLKGAVGDAIENTVNQAGSLSKYRGAMSDFATGMDQQQKLDTIIKWAKNVGIGALGTTTAGALGAAGWKLYNDLFGK